MYAKSKFIQTYKALSPDERIMFKQVMAIQYRKNLKQWIKTAWRYSDKEDRDRLEYMSSNELKRNTLDSVFDLYDFFILNKKV